MGSHRPPPRFASDVHGRCHLPSSSTPPPAANYILYSDYLCSSLRRLKICSSTPPRSCPLGRSATTPGPLSLAATTTLGLLFHKLQPLLPLLPRVVADLAEEVATAPRSHRCLAQALKSPRPDCQNSATAPSSSLFQQPPLASAPFSERRRRPPFLEGCRHPLSSWSVAASRCPLVWIVCSLVCMLLGTWSC